MLLKKLINNPPKKNKNINIRGLAVDSKKVKKGYIFFAIRGLKQNGETYINEAIRRGAIVIVCSKKCKFFKKNTIVIKTSNTRYLLSEISSKFYKLKPKNIIAVTGTNGKTSVADLFYQFLTLNKIPVASIGTLGIKFKNKIINSELTSPDTISLHKELEKLKKNKIDNVIIEASSHGLHQKRIEHLNLIGGIFTNFSQDHLDYHKTMKTYLKSKLHLFESILGKKKAVISDSSIKEFKTLKKICEKKSLKLIDINQNKRLLENNISLKLDDFKSKNILMAAAAAKLCSSKKISIFDSLKKLKDVNGRLELISTFSNIKVFIDFAHTPDALLKTLNEIKSSIGENISLVFGCGGERDFKKRALMAKIASKNCQKIYVTDDNPRNEKPENIRKEIIKHISNKNYYNIGNRSKAIKTAILKADPNEIILVAGKGHETKQIYKNKVINISDKQIIKNLKHKLKLKKRSPEKETFFQNKKIFKDLENKDILKNFHGLAIDSRVVKKENLFLTIKGKNNDGSKFISKALKKGASYVVSSKKLKKFKKKTIYVKNEINFLNKFASIKRNYTNAIIIGITGSAGKTSLKNLLKDLLKNYGKTFFSPKSYNNHYGVPLSLSQLKTNDKFGIFEIGMSKSGEINFLSNLVKPHIGIISNIGEAHIENFKSLKDIASAKGELIDNISKNGSIILNRDDKYFKFLEKKAKQKNLKILTFGFSKESDICLEKKIESNKKTQVKVKILNRFFSFKIGNVNVYNVLASLAILKQLNLDPSKILKIFRNYEPTEGRGKIYKINRYKKFFKLIDESYNANPLSVKTAINNFNVIKKQNFKKYLLLGDMLELGKKSKILHKDLSKVINKSDIDKVFVKGDKALVTYKNIVKNKRGNIFQQDEDIDFTLKNIISNNDYLMIKGSNATGLNNMSKRMIRGL